MFAAALLLIHGPTVTFAGLLREMSDPSSLSRWPKVGYEAHQAASTNRDSVKRGEPGWFADSDGTGYIRTVETTNGTEYVVMEHTGPGCITKVWTPFFYYGFDDLTGPNIRIRLDGDPVPAIEEPLISLVTGKGTVAAPFAACSARAGNLYLPIPFGKSALVTLSKKPFYYSINYRSYNNDTHVETFTPLTPKANDRAMKRVAEALQPAKSKPVALRHLTVPRGGRAVIFDSRGPRAVTRLNLRLDSAKSNPGVLRSTVLVGEFDDEETVWSPVGDFFCCADSIHPFWTLTRSVTSDGLFTSSWTMPFRKSGKIWLENHSGGPVSVSFDVASQPQGWDKGSMHFFARWRPDDVVPGAPFSDWNFVDVQGQGMYVGDSWTVLNVRMDSWWGEGDEKVYVDGAYDKGIPTHFGTGSEDYYGWAGGEYPTVNDEFSSPFLANVKVGGLDGHTMGYNVLTRARGLDAVPFHQRLRFDMESSFGTDMRERWNLLDYSVVTFFYAVAGSKNNRPPAPRAASQPILTPEELQRKSDEIRLRGRTTG